MKESIKQEEAIRGMENTSESRRSVSHVEAAGSQKDKKAERFAFVMPILLRCEFRGVVIVWPCIENGGDVLILQIQLTMEQAVFV